MNCELCIIHLAFPSLNRTFVAIMDKKDLRIVYMGTPDFAVAALDRLVTEGYQVVGVVTMPDKAIGRHHDVLQASPVKQYAVEHGLPVLQPEKLKAPEFLEALASLNADLQIVVAFRMLPQAVWGMPRLGTFNLHAALLPQYRGAAPINWAIINGDEETGLTTFFLDEDIDTGQIILQQRMPIGLEDCLEDIHDRMMVEGAELVTRTVDLILSGEAKSIPQEQFMTDAPLRPAPKIFKETCQLLWDNHTVKSAYDFVRGLSPYPAAWALLTAPNGQQLNMKIFRTAMQHCTPQEPVGTLLTDGKSFMKVALADGYLNLLDIQLNGKKRMGVADFLRGAHLL